MTRWLCSSGLGPWIHETRRNSVEYADSRYSTKLRKLPDLYSCAVHRVQFVNVFETHRHGALFVAVNAFAEFQREIDRLRAALFLGSCHRVSCVWAVAKVNEKCCGSFPLSVV